MSRLALLCALLLGLTGLLGPMSVALAVEPEEQLADPALEARARELSKELRCVVCQNQSIDDSNADIAADIRKLVRERISAGDSDAQVKDRLVEYYGEYVLLRPRFSLANLALWLAGPLALALGLIWVRRRLGAAAPGAASPEAGGTPPLSDDEKRRLDELMRD